MATGKPRGRPPKEQKDRVPHVYSLRLSDIDNAKIQSNIARSGLSESEYLRESVIRNKTTVIGDMSKFKRTAKRVAAPGDANATRLLFLAAQTSNNCNQLAHAVNSAKKMQGGISQNLLEEILAELHKINETAKGLV